MLVVFLLNIYPTCIVNLFNGFLLRNLYNKVMMKGHDKNVDDEMFCVDIFFGYIYMRYKTYRCDSYNLYV